MALSVPFPLSSIGFHVFLYVPFFSSDHKIHPERTIIGVPPFSLPHLCLILCDGRGSFPHSARHPCPLPSIPPLSEAHLSYNRIGMQLPLHRSHVLVCFHIHGLECPRVVQCIRMPFGVFRQGSQREESLVPLVLEWIGLLELPPHSQGSSTNSESAHPINQIGMLSHSKQTMEGVSDDPPLLPPVFPFKRRFPFANNALDNASR